MNKKIIMSIIELGLVADPAPLYRQAGFVPETFGSLRRALLALKSLRPDVIACEFIYLPTYSMRISNLEPLLAAMELRCPGAGLLIYVDREHLPQLQRIPFKDRRYEVVSLPADEASVQEALRRLCPPAGLRVRGGG